VGWCLARRIAGTEAREELGFRFGEPLDVDGDGRADIAAGARFTLQGTFQNGTAIVWSGATGTPIRVWQGEFPDGLFGHWVMPVPDLGHDGLADVVIAAPAARVDDETTGILVARSPKTGDVIWTRRGRATENFGWDLALAGDHDGDGKNEIFVGAPSSDAGRVALVRGSDGTEVRSYAPPKKTGMFGWFVARTPDLDGDGRGDLVVGAPYEANADGERVGGAWVLSSADGRELHHWQGKDAGSGFGFGEVVAAFGDMDGDGKGDVAIGTPRTNDHARERPGEVRIYSSVTGKELAHWSGSQPGELFGRLVAGAGDVDGDGTEDLAIGAPWYRRGTADKTGRLELRSGRSGKVLAEFFGDEADCWFGWHVRRAPDPDGRGRPALLIGSLRHPVDGKLGVGALDLYVLRQGTTTRDVRRNDIK
jgi:hypothetical protein